MITFEELRSWPWTRTENCGEYLYYWDDEIVLSLHLNIISKKVIYLHWSQFIGNTRQFRSMMNCSSMTFFQSHMMSDISFQEVLETINPLIAEKVLYHLDTFVNHSYESDD